MICSELRVARVPTAKRPEVTDEQLVKAIADLRADPRPEAKGWHTVSRFIRQCFPARGSALREDAQQETLLTVYRSIGQLQVVQVRVVRTWLWRIWNSRLRDLLRRTRRIEREVWRDTEHVDHPVDAPPIRLAFHRLEQVLEELDRQVVAHLAVSADPSRRALRRAQSRATVLRRVHHLGVEEIAHSIAWPTALSANQVYKWTERGRDPVLAAIDRWVNEHPGDAWTAGVAAALRDVIGWERGDAGRPRPNRRRAA